MLSGVCGYFLGPQHASTALLGGVGGSILVTGLSILNRRRVQWAQTSLQSALGVFALTFAWRGAGAWKSVVESHPDHLPIALLLSFMCLVSVFMLVLVFRRS